MGFSPRRATSALLAAALVLSLALVGGADGPVLCNMTRDDLRECQPAATAPDPSPPSAACCAGLGRADLPCLCSYRHSLLLPALGVDPDLAMELPPKCGLTPPEQC